MKGIKLENKVWNEIKNYRNFPLYVYGLKKEYTDIIKELEKQNEELKKKVLNVKDACYCELCFGLEKQNEKLIKNTLVLLDALCSEDGCQDFKYCDKTRESKCSEVSNTEKLLVEIKQKPIEEILKEVNDEN